MLEPKYIVYEDGVIAVGLFAKDAEADKKNFLDLGVRWLPPQSYQGKDGQTVKTTNAMGGETQWFLLPYSFGVAIGRSLIEQNVSGLTGFNESGFRKMVSWLVEMEGLSDAMCY